MLSRTRPLTLLVLLSLILCRLCAAEPADVAALRVKAEKGNAVAQYNLGLIYLDGQRVPVDAAEAFAWLSLASENGSKAQALQSLVNTMPAPQLAEGRKRLEQYRAAVASKGKITTTAPTIPSAASAQVNVAKPTPAPTPKVVTTPAPATVPAVGPSESANASRDSAELITLRNDRVQLSDELALAWKENAQLKKDLSAAQSAIETAKKRDTEQSSAIARLEQQVKATSSTESAELATAKKEIESARAAAAASAANQSAAESSLAALKSENQQLRDERKNLEATRAKALAAAESQTRDALSQLTTLKTQLASAEAARASLSTEKSAGDENLRRLGIENDSLKTQLTHSVAEGSQRELQLKEQTAQLRQAREQADSAKALTVARDNAESARAKLAVTIESQNQTIAGLKQELASAREAASSAAEAKAATEKLTAQVRTLQTQTESLKTKLAESESARSDLAAKETAAVESAKASAAELAALRAQAKSVDTGRAQSVSEKETLSRQLDAARADLASATRQTEILRTQLSAAATDASAARKDAADARIKLTLGESARRDLMAELTLVRAQVKEVLLANDAAKTRIAQLTEENAQLKARVAR
jgi:chromosome segregation ATPase